MTALIQLSSTPLNRFLRCEYEHFAYHELGIYKQRRVAAPNRDRGQVFHALKEHVWRHYAATDTVLVYDRLTAREIFKHVYRTEGTDVDEQTGEQLIAAVNYHIARLNLPDWEVVRLADGTPLIEHELFAPCIRDVDLRAKIDIVLRRKATGLIWQIDWKSTVYPIDIFQFPPFIEHDYQLTIQREVLRHSGVDVDMTAFCHLRSLAPEQPPVVYANTPRQRTSVDVNKLSCDWDTYRAALVERHENPDAEAYVKVREQLNRQTFVRWQVDTTSETGRAATLREIRRAAMRIRSIARGEEPAIRRLVSSPRNGCSRCDYHEWCQAAMRNGGAEDLSLLGTDYLARDGGKLAGSEQYGPRFDPSKAYVEFAAAHGRTIEPHQEFTP